MHPRNQAHPHWLRNLAAGCITALALLAPARAPADEAAPPASAGHAAGVFDAEVERQAESISRSIMSPFCPGRTVSACPNAGPWREDIRKWVGEGVDASEIKRRLAERVPEHNLAGVPKNRLGWILPVGCGVGAIATLVLLLRRLVSSPRPTNAPSKAPKKRDSVKSKGPAPDAKDAKAKSETEAAEPAPAAGKSKDWDAQLDRELESMDP